MQTATISSQGQILIPKKIREALGITSGMRITFVPYSYSIALVPQKKDWIKKTKGILKEEIEDFGGVEKAHLLFEKEWDKKKGETR